MADSASAILSSLGSPVAKNHDKEKDPGFIPATPPAHLPAIDLLADLNGSGQAKEFGLQFHGSHLCLWLGCTVKPRKRSTESTEGWQFTTMPEKVIPFPQAP